MNRDVKEENERMVAVALIRLNERLHQNIEPFAICSTFGCAHRLSLVESLAGTKCTDHMNSKPINITSTIKKP